MILFFTYIVEDVDDDEYAHSQVDLPQQLFLQRLAHLSTAKLCVEVIRGLCAGRGLLVSDGGILGLLEVFGRHNRESLWKACFG